MADRTLRPGSIQSLLLGKAMQTTLRVVLDDDDIADISASMPELVLRIRDGDFFDNANKLLQQETLATTAAAAEGLALQRTPSRAIQRQDVDRLKKSRSLKDTLTNMNLPRLAMAAGVGVAAASGIGALPLGAVMVGSTVARQFAPNITAADIAAFLKDDPARVQKALVKLSPDIGQRLRNALSLVLGSALADELADGLEAEESAASPEAEESAKAVSSHTPSSAAQPEEEAETAEEGAPSPQPQTSQEEAPPEAYTQRQPQKKPQEAATPQPKPEAQPQEEATRTRTQPEPTAPPEEPAALAAAIAKARRDAANKGEEYTGTLPAISRIPEGGFGMAQPAPQEAAATSPQEASRQTSPEETEAAEGEEATTPEMEMTPEQMSAALESERHTAQQAEEAQKEEEKEQEEQGEEEPDDVESEVKKYDPEKPGTLGFLYEMLFRSYLLDPTALVYVHGHFLFYYVFKDIHIPFMPKLLYEPDAIAWVAFGIILFIELLIIGTFGALILLLVYTYRAIVDVDIDDIRKILGFLADLDVVDYFINTIFK